VGPRFEDPLYFEPSGALEVCGPAGLGPNDVLLRIEHVAVKDSQGTERQVEGIDAEHPLVVGTGDGMWESEIENAQGDLVPGPGIGFGQGVMVMRNGASRPVHWATRLTLVDPLALFAEEP
jgi:hypothetical protein